MPDRGLSEALGFVLVFALVMGTVSTVTVVGLGELREVQDAQRVDNAGAAMEVLADNVDDLVLEGVSRRSTEISLPGGRLAFGDPVTVTVRGEAVENPARNFTYRLTTRPLIYAGDDGEQIAYNAGALFRSGPAGVTMVEEPPLLRSPDAATVAIVQTRRGGTSAGLGGSSTVLVRAKRAVADLYQVNDTQYDIAIDVDSPRAEAWARALGDRAGTTCSTPSAGTATCTFTADRVGVAVVRIDLALH